MMRSRLMDDWRPLYDRRIVSPPRPLPFDSIENAFSALSVSDFGRGVSARVFPFWDVNLGEMRGRIVAMARDQHGCRLLQKILCEMRRDQINLVFDEVIEHCAVLMVDPFANYVVQKLVEVCREDQRRRILLTLCRNEFSFVRICLNMHGTRAVQKLLSYISSPEEVSVVIRALYRGAVALTKDPNGHHVIQHCLKHFSAEDNALIMAVIAENAFTVSTNKSGCCVMQLCVQYSRGEIRKRLTSEIIANSLLLSEDRYGNYVVQHLLGLRMPDMTEKLLYQLRGSFASLSCNKYGSNVVEKCLSETSDQQASMIIIELITSPNASSLILDPYGNYVIQCALSVAKGATQAMLLDLIKVNYVMLSNNMYGQKVLSRFHKKRSLMYN